MYRRWTLPLVLALAAGCHSTERVSVSTSGEEGFGTSNDPAVSGDGRFVVFDSSNRLVPEDTNLTTDVYVRDRVNRTTERVSVASDGSPANDRSELADISDDGRFVIFASFASNLVLGDTNEVPDVFLHERASGETTRVSLGWNGVEANGSTSLPDPAPVNRSTGNESPPGV